MEDMDDMKKMCNEFYNSKSLIKVVRKHNEGYTIGFIDKVSDTFIIVKNDRNGLKTMITFSSIDVVFEMSGGDSNGY